MESELHWCRFCFELLVTALCYAVTAVYELGNLPVTRRGFFCDDESIRYPYTGNTVTVAGAMAYSFPVPVVLILITEYAIGRRSQNKWFFVCCFAPEWIYKIYKYLIGFLFSMGITLVLDAIVKNLVGRLRPCFIDLCQPDLDLESCNTTENEYITNYTCTNGVNWETYGRQSFFSGSTAIVTCASVFAVLYIYQRWNGQGTWKFLTAFVSFLLILTALCIGLTRFMDNAHFATDVLTGFFVGSGVAYLIVRFVCDMFENSPNSESSEMETGNPEKVGLTTTDAGPVDGYGGTSTYRFQDTPHFSKMYPPR